MEYGELDRFELRASGDAAKRDLELVCTACDEHICDAEANDTLSSLARMAAGHTCTVDAE
mgnify:CR=1 FL=1